MQYVQRDNECTVSNISVLDVEILHLSTKITDRRRERTLAANPASEQPATHETAARGGGSVHLLVRRSTAALPCGCKHNVGTRRRSRTDPVAP